MSWPGASVTGVHSPLLQLPPRQSCPHAPQSLAVELAADRILVNAVLPSIIDTPANRASMPKADHATWPKPAEIAEAVVFLVSPENTLTSGTLLPVFGRA